MQTDQLTQFNARIKRINDPKNVSYFDVESKMHIPKRVPRDVIRKTHLAKKPTLMILIISMVIGAVCLMGARYARFNLLALIDVSDTTLVVELALAAITAFVIGGLVGLKTLRHMGAQIVGVGLMAVAMHNLVWLFPDQFALVYSQAFVDQVYQTTQPGSLFVRGVTYTL